MLFVNQTGLPDDQVFLTFQDPSQTLSATYGGGTTVSRATAGDVMTNSYSLTQLGSGGFNISNASSVVMFVSYAATVANNGFDMSGDLSGNAEPSYIGTGGTNYSKAYQPFEITAVNGATNGQGNLTNINYFTAPISVQTYHGGANGTLLQSRGYFGNTATGTAAIANQLAALTRGPNSSLATATLNGNVLRYIGPSSYGAGTNPYPTFNSYLGALNTSGQVTKIQNSNAFNTQANPTTGNLNYNYTLDFQATVAADNTITLSGNIYTTITPFGGAPYAGTTYTGASMTISPTIGANTNSAIFNNTIYGQADPLGSGKGSTTFNSVWGQLATDMANAGLYLNTAAGGGPGTTYGTTQSLAIGEITTGLLGGFAGSNAVYQSGSDTGPYAQYNGMLYKDVPSEAWWNSTIIPSPSTLQPSNPYYSGYSDVIFNATDNGVYSIPFSDRFGTGPLMQTQSYTDPNTKTTSSVDTWVVTLGAPIFAVPEPATYAYLAMGGLLLAVTAWKRGGANRRGPAA